DGSFTHHDDLSDFLTAVQTGSIDNNWGTRDQMTMSNPTKSTLVLWHRGRYSLWLMSSIVIWRIWGTVTI
ncbi:MULTISPECIES: hypothetical protein, partial [unclassified Lactococcus]|uniref:hypothetical protein n=1 Tax=unclassified Lactococcus TaxID=2643510 RepID=UPI00257B9E8B